MYGVTEEVESNLYIPEVAYSFTTTVIWLASMVLFIAAMMHSRWAAQDKMDAEEADHAAQWEASTCPYCWEGLKWLSTRPKANTSFGKTATFCCRPILFSIFVETTVDLAYSLQIRRRLIFS